MTMLREWINAWIDFILAPIDIAKSAYHMIQKRAEDTN